MKRLLLTLTALAVSSAGWCETYTLEKGSVVCRNKQALEAMHEAGGYDKLPEFLLGTACFKLANELTGQITSKEPDGVIEVEPRQQRRRLAQPANLWLQRPTEPSSQS